MREIDLITAIGKASVKLAEKTAIATQKYENFPGGETAAVINGLMTEQIRLFAELLRSAILDEMVTKV
jgi:hypothetical protein